MQRQISPGLCAPMLLAFVLTGCAMDAKKPQQSRQPAAARAVGGGALDPCANRLHDLEGALLAYWQLNKRLPSSLSDLSALGFFDKPLELTCPASGKPYVYNPVGFELPQKPGRVIIYDPEPAHDGVRWGITIEERNGPMITRVVGFAESELKPKS